MTKTLKNSRLNTVQWWFLTAVNAVFSLIGVSFVLICVFYPEKWGETFSLKAKIRYVQAPEARFRESVDTSAVDTIKDVW